MEDRNRQRIRAFWADVEKILKNYAQRFSAVRTLRLLNREGFYLVAASAVLLGLAIVAAWRCVPDRWAYLLVLPPVYYVADSILVNTSITFISQQPIHQLRSVLLTMLNILNVGLGYAVAYAAQREAFTQPLSAIQSIYFSFATLTTLGYGDIKPDGPRAWTGQVTVVLELATGLYLLACVLTVVVSWAQHREAERQERRRVILQKAHDVARDSQSLLDVTARTLVDLALRKYTAHRLARDTAGLTGEQRRRTVNAKTMRIHLQEAPRSVLDNLAIMLHSHLIAVPDDDGRPNLLAAARDAAASASLLSEELKKILPFPSYFDQVQFQAENETFVDFVEKMEQDETASYEPIKSARGKARDSLLRLVRTIAEYSREAG